MDAHAADRQQVQLHAEKEGYVPTTIWQPAGDPPAVLMLQQAVTRAAENH